MTLIPFDVDQVGWGSTTEYGDGTKLPWTPDKWVIHHGGGANVAGSLEKAEAWCDQFGPDCPVEQAFPSTANEVFMLRRWQNYHINGKGWTDLAYNWAIGQSGVVYRIRGENRSGATSGDYEGDGIPENNEARAVVWIGGEGQEPTPEAYAAFQRLWAADKKLVIGHSDVKNTACPGDYWRAYIADAGYETDVPVEPPVDPPPIVAKCLMPTLELYDGYLSTGRANHYHVKICQAVLAINGYLAANTFDDGCAPDGLYGPGTQAAVESFQRYEGIPVNGICGDDTWAYLLVPA